MKKQTKQAAALLMATAMSATMLAGCGSSASKAASSTGGTASDAQSTTADTTNEAPVELSFYMQNGPVNDADRVMGKVNEILKEKLNVTLNMVMVDPASYADKMNLMINSGDEWDLCFTASWGGMNYFENAAKGAYADLTELIPQYAPETYARIPESLWDGVKVDGKIYSLVNYQQWGSAKRFGFKFRSDIAEEVGFDWKALKGKSTIEVLKGMDPLLSAGLAAHPDMIGFEALADYSLFADDPLYWDMEAVGDTRVPGWVRYDEAGTVINQFETDEFAQFCDVMRDWYNKGYVRKDGATVKDNAPDRKAAKFIAEKCYGWPDSVDFPGNADVEKMSMCTKDIAPSVAVSNTRTMMPAAAASTAAVAINAQSPNVIRALQFMELLNTDDELYMLLTQGEEGVDYIYNDDGSYALVDGKYNFNYNEWQVGQSYSPDFTRALYERNEAGDNQKAALKVVYDASETADPSPMTGFTFDPTPVKTQIATCSSVMDEMIPALSCGAVDPAKALPEFLQRLKTAGVDDIVAEKQSQLDAWKAAK